MASQGSNLGITRYVRSCISVISARHQSGRKVNCFPPSFSVGKNVLLKSGSVKICPIVLGLHRLPCRKLAQVISSLL